MTIKVTLTANTTVVEIVRPPVNTFDFDTVSSLEATFRKLDIDKPLVFTGAGETFSAGVDVKSFANCSADDRKRFVQAITRMTSALMGFHGPVVAAVNGHALGGGFVMILCADYRIGPSEKRAKFGLTEAKAGIPFPAGPAEIIRNELTPPVLRRLTLTSHVFDTQTLLAYGVIDELSPTDKLLDRAIICAEEMAAQPGFKAVKQQVRGGLSRRLSELSNSGEDPFMSAFI